MKVFSRALAMTWCVLLMAASSWAQIPVGYSHELNSVFYAADSGDGWQVVQLELDGARPVDDGRILHDSGWRVSRVELAPSGSRIALTERLFEENARNGNYFVKRIADGAEVTDRYYENSRLIILDAGGGVVADPVDAVRDYAWSPAGDKVAYVTGDYYEGGMGFLSTGTWILDVSSGRSKKIHESGWGVTWTEWDDDGIYMLELSGQPARVLRYDMNRDEVGPTGHRGLFFSPGGRYYFDPAGDGEPTRVFETDGDRDVTMDHEFLASGDARYLRPRGWLDDRTLVIPHPTSDWRDVLYFVDEKSASVADGRVIGGPESEGPAGELLLWIPPGEVVRTTIDDLRRQ